MKREVTFDLGIVVERREITHRWARYSWKPVEVRPLAQKVEGLEQVDAGEGWVRFLTGPFTIDLHRKETEAYIHNIETGRPMVYVVMQPVPAHDDQLVVLKASVSAHAAQDLLDSGDVMVEPVPMPDDLALFVEAFIQAHHKQEPFKKRKRDKANIDEPGFGKVLSEDEQRFYDRQKLKS